MLQTENKLNNLKIYFQDHEILKSWSDKALDVD